MSTIVLRNTKGSPLTWQEGDDNFNNLNTDKIEALSDDASPQLGGNLDVNNNSIQSGSNNQVTINANGAVMVFENQELIPGVNASVMRADNQQYVTVVTGGTSILASSNTSNISVEYNDGTNGRININPSGSGIVNIIVDDVGTNGEFTASFNKDNLYDWDNSAFSDPTLGTAINAYDIGASASAPIGLRGSAVILATQQQSSIVLQAGTNADIRITPNGTGDLVLDGLNWPQADGSADQVLKTNGSGQLSWTTVSSGSGTVTSVAVSVPTGLTITSGSPVTTSGTIAIGLESGYAIPSTTSQTNWDTAYTDRLKWDGGSTGLTASTGRTSLGATTVGSNIFTLTNPSAIRFLRVNADNTVTALSDTDFRTAIGAGTSSFNAASPGAIGGTTASTGAFTTLSATTTGTSGALSVTYNPASASGAAVNLTGKDSQGGTGYFDFLKITNTTSGATNANKTFRTNSTGQLEIVNSAYGTVILSLTDAGLLTAPSLSISKDIRETVYTSGSTTGTITPDCANGTVQKITLTGNITFNAFANAVAGQSMTLVITQSSSGNNTLTSTMKFSGASKTLSTAANAIDIMSVFYDGSTYYASLAKGFA